MFIYCRKSAGYFFGCTGKAFYEGLYSFQYDCGVKYRFLYLGKSFRGFGYIATKLLTAFYLYVYNRVDLTDRIFDLGYLFECAVY